MTLFWGCAIAFVIYAAVGGELATKKYPPSGTKPTMFWQMAASGWNTGFVALQASFLLERPSLSNAWVLGLCFGELIVTALVIPAFIILRRRRLSAPS